MNYVESYNDRLDYEWCSNTSSPLWRDLTSQRQRACAAGSELTQVKKTTKKQTASEPTLTRPWPHTTDPESPGVETPESADPGSAQHHWTGHSVMVTHFMVRSVIWGGHSSPAPPSKLSFTLDFTITFTPSTDSLEWTTGEPPPPHPYPLSRLNHELLLLQLIWSGFKEEGGAGLGAV